MKNLNQRQRVRRPGLQSGFFLCLRLGLVIGTLVCVSPPSEAAPAVVQEGAPQTAPPSAATPAPPPAPEQNPATPPAAHPQGSPQASFSYNPEKMTDPFSPFITPSEPAAPQLPAVEDDGGPPPEPQRPLTPLQRMTLGEIEKGLKAITWGELGRKAVIEDSAGKGYIVSVGTPVGERNGTVTQILNDRMVIQQEIWDRKSKRMLPQTAVVKLKKEP